MLLGELKSVEIPLKNFVNKELPIRYAFQLNKIIEEISTELTRAEKFRVELVNKYGELIAGDVVVPNKLLGKFGNEFKELMGTEISIEAVSISLDELDECNVKMSVQDINALLATGFIRE